VRIRKYTDQYGVPQLMMVQKGDPAPMEISSPEDEEGFTIGTKGAKTTRKDKGARRKVCTIEGWSSCWIVEAGCRVTLRNRSIEEETTQAGAEPTLNGIIVWFVW
jgi:hypothetical protein